MHEQLTIKKTTRRVLLGLVLWLGVSQISVAWEVKSISGRDYVPLSEAAAFYDLGTEASPDANTRKYSSQSRELVVTKNSRVVTINGVSHWLAFPVVEDGGGFFLSRLDLGKTIEPAFRPQLLPDLKPVRTVVIDPGHGGKDIGAQGPYESEKNFTLDVSRRVRDQLKKAGMRVLLTRNSDTFVELQDRAAVANRIPDSIFVSVHFNAADWNRSAEGFEIFCVTPRGAPSTAYEDLRVRDMIAENGNEHDLHSFALANAVFHSMHGRLTMFDRGVKRARFAVLRLTTVPSILIEGGFLTNPEDARKVASKQWREDYAASIARGIMEYSKLAAKGIPPRQLADYRSGAAPVANLAVAPTPTPAPEVMLRDLPAASTN